MSEGLVWFLASISLSLVAYTKKIQMETTATMNNSIVVVTDEYMTDESTEQIHVGSPGKTLTRNESEYSLGLNSQPFVVPLGKPCFYSWPTIVVGMIKDESVKLVVLSALLIILLRTKK